VEDEAKSRGKFIGFIQPYDYGWRASFRTLMAVKWLHTQASTLGFTTIDIRRK
jgi:hypothetical protein